MWGFGGRHYWGRKERGKVEGIVVVFAWMSSQDRHLKNYVDLYSSLGWNSLVRHSQFLNLFFPDKAASLALEIVSDLVQELKIRPCPVVFASFSGGPKACSYKFLQIIEGKCEEQANVGTSHVSYYTGHFQHFPVEYKAVLTELLGKASVIYSQRIRKLEGEKMGLEGTHYDISEPFGNLKKAAAGSNYSFQTIPHHSNDNFLVPSSIEDHEDRDVGSVHDEHKDRYIHLSSPPKISAHGVLGRFLFDPCVPKNVEDWVLKS